MKELVEDLAHISLEVDLTNNVSAVEPRIFMKSLPAPKIRIPMSFAGQIWAVAVLLLVKSSEKSVQVDGHTRRGYNDIWPDPFLTVDNAPTFQCHLKARYEDVGGFNYVPTQLIHVSPQDENSFLKYAS
jgi:hypothetical protein